MRNPTKDPEESAIAGDLKKIRDHIAYLRFLNEMYRNLSPEKNASIFAEPIWEGALVKSQMLENLSDPMFYEGKPENKLLSFAAAPKIDPWMEEQLQGEDQLRDQRRIATRVTGQQQAAERDAKFDAELGNMRLNRLRQFSVAPGEATRPDYSWQELLRGER